MLELLKKSVYFGKKLNYGDALHHFEEISEPAIKEKFSSFKDLLSDSISINTAALFNTNDVADLLSIEVLDAVSDLSFESVKRDYRNLSNLIKSEGYDDKAITYSLRCCLYSPFQLDLLLITSWFISNKNLLVKCDDISRNLHSMAALLRVVYDKSFRHSVYGSFLNIYQNHFDVNKFFHDLDSLSVESIFSSCNLDFLYDIPSKNYTYNVINKDITGHSLSIGTIFLNEEKYINLSLEQHYQLCSEWTLVEGACQGYPPRKVSKDGLSLDKSQLLVRAFPDKYKKLKYFKHGWTVAKSEDAKSELRNRYLRVSKSTVLLVLDADEFYFSKDIYAILRKFDDPSVSSVTLPQVHFWKDLRKFITGEYYDISHTRFFRLIPGAVYKQNHNFPEIDGVLLNKINNIKVKRTIMETPLINDAYEYNDYCCFHLGFAKDFDDMRDKSDYYINRGEATTRESTTKSRAAWFDDQLPEKCIVRNWGGSVPSCLIGLDGENK